MNKTVFAFVTVSVFVAAIPAVAQTPTSAVINFETLLNPGDYSGAPEFDPFASGTEFNDLINGVFGPSAGPGSQDWLKFLGQIVIPNYTGDGTYTSTSDGLGIYLHSPLLNRIETVSWRTEGALSAASLALPAGRADGQPTQQRDDIYVPDFDPNGVVSVTISGSSVTIDYLLDFDALPATNSVFLRDGVTDTDISDRLNAVGSRFLSIGVNGTGTDTADLFEVGVDDASIPYGAFYTLDPLLNGNLANTIVDTSLALLRNEIANEGNTVGEGNISTTGRSNTEAVDFFEDPYAGRDGEFVAVFDLVGAPLATTVALTIPEPGSASLALAGLAALVARRRRK
ncbi:MAG: PEP-CTERM sorting domain-containing protein [Planctomycetota bacterium]